MKKIGLLLLLLITTSLQAQIQKMSELSQNKFLDSKIIYEDNGEDIWGYFLLTQADKVSKDVLQLEFIILDKNLNKIGSNTFQQDYFNSWLIDVMPAINAVLKNKNELLFAIGFDYEASDIQPYAFRKINLNDFTIGNCFMFIENKKIEDNNLMKRLTIEKKVPTFFTPISNQGFLNVTSNLSYVKQMRLAETNRQDKIDNGETGYVYYDLDFNNKWSFIYDKIENGYENHKLLYSKNNIIIFFKNYSGKSYKKKNSCYYKIIDQNTGTELGTIPLFDSNYIYNNPKIIFNNDNIIFLDKIYEFSVDDTYDLNKCLGYSKRVFNITSKKVTEQKFFYWTDLLKFIEIDKNGKVGNSDYIQFLDIKITSDGKILIIGEGYQPAKNSKIKNIYTLEMDKDFKVKSFNEILKNKNSISNLYAWGDTLENYNTFDFMYSQKITDDEFIYFYQDNEKGKKNKIWTLGAIVYADGKFSNQKINLKTESGIIKPIKAKKGYIILQETSDKNENTIRLEKIEY